MWQWKDVDALFSLLSASLKRLFRQAVSKLNRDACQRQTSGASQTNFLKLAQRMEAHSVGANRQIILSEEPPSEQPSWAFGSHQLNSTSKARSTFPLLNSFQDWDSSTGPWADTSNGQRAWRTIPRAALTRNNVFSLGVHQWRFYSRYWSS